MEVKKSSWWQKIRKPLGVVGIIAACVLVIGLIVAIIGGYLFNWEWTGVRGGVNKVTTTMTTPGTTTATPETSVAIEQPPAKTIWDWLQLLGVLAIPVVVGLGAAWYTAQQGKVSERESTDNQRETALQAYIDKMSELLLHEKLRDSTEDEVSKVARVRTLTILDRLNADRKRSVLQFLYESRLIDKDKCIIDLTGANLSGINLRGAHLNFADLRYADLSGANLTGAALFDEIEISDVPPDVGMSDVSLSADQRDTEVESLIDVPDEANELSIISPYAVQRDTEAADLRIPYLSVVFLFKANLSVVSLRGADLSDAVLSNADLSFAKFKDAKVTDEQLKQAKSLQGATMPDGSIHP